MPPRERDAVIRGLADGSLDVVTSCALISEGLDVPDVGAAILLRPTQSLTLYLQQIGRALRPKADGRPAVILDHAGNALRHGDPTAPRRWSLEGRPKRLALQAPMPGPQEWWQCTNWADLETIERAVANGLQSAAAFVAEGKLEQQLRRSKGQYELQL